MTQQDMYQHIRAEDKQNLEKVVGELQKAGFTVELRGSAAQRPDYNDIDLLLTGKPNKKANHADLYQVIASLLGEITDERTGPFYMQTLIDGGFQFELGDTKFDVAYAARERPSFTDVFAARMEVNKVLFPLYLKDTAVRMKKD